MRVKSLQRLQGKPFLEKKFMGYFFLFVMKNIWRFQCLLMPPVMFRRCVMHLPSGDQVFRDFWNANQLRFNIPRRRWWLRFKQLKQCRVGFLIMSGCSGVVIDSFKAKSIVLLRSSPLHLLNCSSLSFPAMAMCSLSFSPAQNKAVVPSRRHLSPLESMLSPRAWRVVEYEFGGDLGHSFELMALDCNDR